MSHSHDLKPTGLLSRQKWNAKPEIVEALWTWRGNARPLVGEQVGDVVGDLQQGEIYALVEVTFKGRAYSGQRSTDSATFRLVALRNEATGQYDCYLTNLLVEIVSKAQVTALYGEQWEIDRLFRELKST